MKKRISLIFVLTIILKPIATYFIFPVCLKIIRGRTLYECYNVFSEHIFNVFYHFEFYILNNLDSLIPSEIRWTRIGQIAFFGLFIYLTVNILYYFGTIEGRKNQFFTPGALMTTLLFFLTTYGFGIYIENFSNYNQLYGSIGALLIFLLYIWMNSNILLLGFELNATLTRFKIEPKVAINGD